MKVISFSQAARRSAALSFALARRDKTVVMLIGFFLTMVMVAAYLGWSATNTANAIYEKAVPVLEAQGRAIPPNPVGDAPPLNLFRNMVTYVALLGGLAALALGYQVAAVDRRQGIVPLQASRPVSKLGIAAGKILAILATIGLVLAISAAINALTFLLVPSVTLSSGDLARLAGFYGASALYMLAFALLGAWSAAKFSSESLALLVPVSIWLALTFIVPQMTANIGPMAALNPVSANIVPPNSGFFTFTSTVLGPISVAEAYRFLAASSLQVMTGAGTATTTLSAIFTLVVAVLIAAGLFLRATSTLDSSRSAYLD